MTILEDDPTLAEFHAAYVHDLSDTLAAIDPWWRALGERLGRDTLRLRWPCGRASHPRVQAVYRTHFANFERLLAARRGAPVAQRRFSDDAAWGEEAEPEPALLLSPAPHRLLVDLLQVEAPELYLVMIEMLLSPRVELPDPTPTLDGLAAVAARVQWREDWRVESLCIETRHGLERGIERLLKAPDDLRPEPMPSVTQAARPELLEMAHAAYRRALEGALIAAERWWSALLFAAEERGAEAEEAEADCYIRHPFGPVSHPRVTGVIQAYWILCDACNGSLRAAERVAPEQFLLAWLMNGRHESWVEVLTAMPYWPIGMDARGSWL